jgi:23S rRNA (adenine2503-C2)-methyltransferase
MQNQNSHNKQSERFTSVGSSIGLDIFAYGLASKNSSGAIPSYLELISELGQPAFRAKQLAGWLWPQDMNKAAQSYEDMDNLPQGLRKQLAEHAPLKRATAKQIQVSKDGTRKYLISFADGVSVEAVGLPTFVKDTGSNTSSGTIERLSVCISTQAGCELGCRFCATGQGGFKRNLLPGEIVEQVRLVATDFDARVSNIVVMGQGEPFRNYDATLAALRILNAPAGQGGFGIGARHITVSTAGITCGIERFASEPEQFTLAVSLHSAIQSSRDSIMPGLRKHSLDALKLALKKYFKKTGRRPSLEYTLIENSNLRLAEVDALIDFARATHAHINLIPLNAHSKTGPLQGADSKRAKEFAAELHASGLEVSTRKRRGADIDAACGQLTQRSP